jgi:hypothetical protein
MNSNMEKPYVVGIDIGGTNTVFGIVDARGTIIASSSIKTSGYPTVEEYADEVCKSLLPLIIANGGVDKIRGIGIGAPNGNYYTGTIEFAPNLPWKGILPLAAMFEERLGIPLFFFERNIEHFYRTIIKPYAKVVFIVNGTKKERNLLTDYVTFDRVFYLIFCSMEILVYLNKDTFMQNIHMPARNGTGCFGSFNER